MFKNATAFHLQRPINHELLLEMQAACPAGEPSTHQPAFTGIESVEALGNGMTIVTLKTVKRNVPASTIKREVEKKIEQWRLQTGNPPGRKTIREFKDLTIDELMPKAFLTESRTHVLFTPEYLIVEGNVEDTISFMARAYDCADLETDLDSNPLLGISYFGSDTAIPAAAKLTSWVIEATPDWCTLLNRATVSGAEDAIHFRNVPVLTAFSQLEKADRLVTELELLSDNTTFRINEKLELKGIRYPRNNEDHAEGYLVANELVRLFNLILKELQ